MNAYSATTSLKWQFHRLFGVLVFSLFSYQAMAIETPVVVRVDHRVTVMYSKIQFDAKTGEYMTQVRIKNRSGTALLAPLRFTLEQVDGKDVRLLNAQGDKKDGLPYYEFTLPKRMLAAGRMTEPTRVVFSLEKNHVNGLAKATRPPFYFTYHVSAGVESALLEPRAEPYALPANSGKKTVRFSVRMVGNAKSLSTVYLRRSGDEKSTAMNDVGKDGDLIAKDGILGVSIQIDTSKVKPDSCLNYEAFTREGRAELISPPLQLCVSSFPVRIAESNMAKPITFPDGIKAVPDEILVRFTPNTSATIIRNLLAEINATVVGSLLPDNLYQARLSTPVSTERMTALINKLRTNLAVAKAYPNALGAPASTPIDPEFSKQHGLQRIRANDVWDAGATGSGIIVAVLDTGIDRTHPDFGTYTGDPKDCQLAANDCGSSNTDYDTVNGHGTAVAGVIAAKTNNNPPAGLGMAGVAPYSKIYSIQVGTTTNYNIGVIRQSFLDARAYGLASVINASLYFGPIIPVDLPLPTLDVGDLCASINTAILNGSTPTAIVVSAAGNFGSNGNYYPARCNDSTNVLHDQLAVANKKYFITVANSISDIPGTVSNPTSFDPVCTNATILDQRCGGTTTGVLNTSNYGAWVDIAAPGMSIQTTRSSTIGGGYAPYTGTSFSAPMVSGAAAILLQCGVPIGQIESELKTGTIPSIPIVPVSFPDGSSAPPLNIYRVLAHLNHAPTGITFSPNIVNENSVTPLEAGTLTATDTDTCDKYTFSIVPKPGDDSASFNISGNKLNFNSGVILDAEAKSSYTVTVHVVDFFSATPPSDTLIAVTINNLNDNPPVITSNGGGATASISVQENTAAVTIVTATDADNLGPLTYSIVGVADAAKFNIDSSTGALTFVVPLPDYEAPTDAGANNVYDIVVQVSDGTFTDTQAIAVTVTNANDNSPVITSNGGGATAFINVPENTAAVTIVTASDLDNLGGLVYSKAGGVDAGKFNIDSSTGALSFAAPLPNYEAPADVGGDNVYDVVVQVSDGIHIATQAIAVSVTNANEPMIGKPVIVPVTPNVDPPVGVKRHVDDVIGADVSGISDADCPGGFNLVGPTCSFSYQWVRGTSNLNATGVGANSNNYKLDASDVDEFMRVCVSYLDGGNYAESGCSDNDAHMVGDPHVFTVDGLHYDFQSEGEFVALRGANGMEIQVRQTAVSTAPPLADAYTGLTSGVSVNSAVAARVGKYRVTYQPDTSPNAASDAFVLSVDGTPTPLPAGGIDLGDGGRVLPQASGGIQIDFPDQTTLMVSTSPYTFYNASWIHFNVFHTPAYEGIMGARSMGSWLPRLSNGSALGAMPAALHDRYVDLYVKFADSWRVNKETSLFDYVDGTSTATFTNKKWPTENGPYVTGNRPVAKPLGLKAAQLACRDVVGKNEKADCVFDVRVLGQKEIAKGHLINQMVRLGATNVVIRGADKLNDRGELVITAMVVRHARVAQQAHNIRAVPGGTIQFMLGDKPLGKPVKLDAKGQAKLVVTRQNLERFNVGKQAIFARYMPTKDKGNMFLPSISRQLTRELAMVGPVVGGKK